MQPTNLQACAKLTRQRNSKRQHVGPTANTWWAFTLIVMLAGGLLGLLGFLGFSRTTPSPSAAAAAATTLATVNCLPGQPLEWPQSTHILTHTHTHTQKDIYSHSCLSFVIFCSHFVCPSPFWWSSVIFLIVVKGLSVWVSSEPWPHLDSVLARLV